MRCETGAARQGRRDFSRDDSKDCRSRITCRSSLRSEPRSCCLRRNRPTPDERADRLRKIESDLARWYEREATAKSEAEQDACYDRIVGLKAEQRELTKWRKAAARPAKPRATISKAQIGALADLSATIQKAKDGGQRLVLALAEHHGLVATLADAATMVIRLELAGGIPIEIEAKLPGDKITEWLSDQQGQHNCAECGKPIDVQRRHYWRGVPKHHHGCFNKVLARRRKEGRSRILHGYRSGEATGY